jgi:hypothetical protein
MSSMCGTLNSCSSAAYNNKRLRSASATAGSVRQPKPLQSTASLMSMAGITDAQIDSCSVRCDMGALTPVRQAVKHVFTNLAHNFSGILPSKVLALCFDRAIRYVDVLLVAFIRGTISSSSQFVLNEKITCMVTSDGLVPSRGRKPMPCRDLCGILRPKQ